MRFRFERERDHPMLFRVIHKYPQGESQVNLPIFTEVGPNLVFINSFHEF